MADGGLTTHYGAEGLAARVLETVDAAGAKDPRTLAALDQFHIGGASATRRLAERARVKPGHRVLDVGSGLGGPARLLARDFGAQVTGLDLMVEFCRVAAGLSARLGVGDRVRICAGDATALPFADASFDLVWSEHVAMNIAERQTLYCGFARVIAPGGRLALYDVVAGTSPGELALPVPWARVPEHSHLVSVEALCTQVGDCGWRLVELEDETDAALEWFATAVGRGPAGPSLVDVMGPDFPSMIANLRTNLAAGRLGVVQAVFEKTA